MTKRWMDTHLEQITLLQATLNQIPEENRIARIEINSQMLVFIGKLAAELSEEYKSVYAARKRMHAEAYIAAKSNKAAAAELAIVDIRQEEAQAYGNMKRWSNAFESKKEEINALKYKVRIDIEDGSSRQGI